ncbi:MAG TPA: alpha/beta fold hydrolase [Gemmataceae bacterium]|nr:alpha/beta fold hydrolase [Gemmataceae bacterium]
MPPQTRRPLSWLSEFLAAAAVFSGVGYLLTAYTLSRWLTRPSRGTPRPTPADFNLPCEDVQCVTKDGFRLAGWVVAPPNPRATVALFHGVRNNRAQTLPRISMLAAAGYRCVAFDHRCHGQSPGRRVSFGYNEAQDVEAVLDFVAERWPTQPCAAIGISMGAAALCFCGRRASRLSACVLESLYHDIASALENRIGTRFPGWLARFTRGLIWVTEMRLGLKLAQVSPADHIANLAPVPMLMLTGTDDPLASPADAQRLCQRFGGVCQLAHIIGADHDNLCTVDPDAYRRLVLEFLDRQMPAQTTIAA